MILSFYKVPEPSMQNMILATKMSPVWPEPKSLHFTPKAPDLRLAPCTIAVSLLLSSVTSRR